MRGTGERGAAGFDSRRGRRISRGVGGVSFGRGGSRAGNGRDLDAYSKEKKTPEGKQTPSNATRIDEPSVSTPVRPSDEAKSVFIQTLHDARL